uniref:Uncharacterized protein n=1 Tax=Plectus sambesii TaxID=2011161 RepID=A0A914X132_9BILA
MCEPAGRGGRVGAPREQTQLRARRQIVGKLYRQAVCRSRPVFVLLSPLRRSVTRPDEAHAIRLLRWLTKRRSGGKTTARRGVDSRWAPSTSVTQSGEKDARGGHSGGSLCRTLFSTRGASMTR